ncbi:penicillin-binding transpeptidase domain-containing protein [Streptomyces millisiae]|uniref:Penicillin-binding transpeptidase domain-containing protein n=1 Tax=Streptomyces millisiae TaxID=3075542 RepID=A0ABU2LZ54_9ACTN|nr:penicillin-binding transpeptidase domain-containing protein [Streptomyces sp. DSM 44918]MDT0322303.1 penicillin-binding transpeptidase domain-containing protein [Streptomyces sp. DSM 44918]
MVIGGAVLVTVLAVVAVLVLRGVDGDGRSDQARDGADAFLRAWADGDLARAASLTDDPEGARSLLDSVAENMGSEETVLEIAGEAEAVEDADEAMRVPFTATFTLGELGDWSYDSAAVMVPGEEDRWLVRWEPAVVHPRLGEGQTLVLTTEEPERAPILAADGSQLAGPSTVWDISLWPAMLSDPAAAYEAIDALDVGVDTEALADRVAAAEPDQAVPVVTLRDADYQEHAGELGAVPGIQVQEDTRPLAHAARSLVGGLDPESGAGSSGLQQRYDEQLAGTPASAVVIADRESGEAVDTLYEQEGGEAGSPVETTIDPEVQAAAEEALDDLGRAGSIVAIRPSSGEVLAAADWPLDGFNRSLQGQLAPGSTFKVVTAAALLEAGVTPDDRLGCPREVTVNGQAFENQNEFELGPETTLREAFTESCNTAFIGNRDRFEDDTLNRTARAFGIGEEWSVGAVTFDGSVPVAEDENALAASLIGQGQVQASPLVMASVAATVADGTFRQPLLVPAAVEEPYQADTELSESTVAALRTMMRATVTEGSASALDGVPGEPHGKTGTAEYRAEDGELSTNAWMIGFLGEGDLAFAVVLEDGGSGGRDAGPLAAAFLTAL